MHAGKHQEYEKKLHDNLVARTAAADGKPTAPIPANGHKQTAKENVSLSSSASSSSSKEGWPQLEKEKQREKEKGKKGKAKGEQGGRKERKEGKADARTEKCKAEGECMIIILCSY